jgi:hypothetical protein
MKTILTSCALKPRFDRGCAGTRQLAGRPQEAEGHPHLDGQSLRRGGVLWEPHPAPLHRLSSYQASAPTLLTLAALFGREFRSDLLQRCADIEWTRALEFLNEADSARVVTEEPSESGHYRFAHALFGETLVDGLSAATRSTLHRRAADALAADPLADHMLAEIAHHHCVGVRSARRFGVAKRLLGTASRRFPALAVGRRSPMPNQATMILGYFVHHLEGADTLEGMARWRLREEAIRRDVDEIAGGASLARHFRWHTLPSQKSAVADSPVRRQGS